MKLATDTQVIAALATEQRGVFSKADLQTALAERHPAAFVRRVGSLLETGILRRFSRGFYVAEDFDLPTLSQRIAPESCVSFGTVLARHLMIGTSPERQVVATKVGRPRRYRGLGVEIDHVGVAPHLLFGFVEEEGVRFATPEKAVLDVLYFHLRGRRYPFDVYSDIDFAKLDATRTREFLLRYRNPKFIAFATKVLELR